MNEVQAVDLFWRMLCVAVVSLATGFTLGFKIGIWTEDKYDISPRHNYRRVTSYTGRSYRVPRGTWKG